MGRKVYALLGLTQSSLFLGILLSKAALQIEALKLMGISFFSQCHLIKIFTAIPM